MCFWNHWLHFQLTILFPRTRILSVSQNLPTCLVYSSCIISLSIRIEVKISPRNCLKKISASDWLPRRILVQDKSPLCAADSVRSPSSESLAGAFWRCRYRVGVPLVWDSFSAITKCKTGLSFMDQKAGRTAFHSFIFRYSPLTSFCCREIRCVNVPHSRMSGKVSCLRVSALDKFIMDSVRWRNDNRTSWGKRA